MAEDDSDKPPQTEDGPDLAGSTPAPALWLQSGQVGSVAGSQPPGKSSGLPDSLTPDPELVSDLKGVRDRESAAVTGVLDRQGAESRSDRGRAQKAFDAASVGPDSMPKQWNADAEWQKVATNPIAAFGSAASILGIMASAFTHQPLINSLNASAAAMNAIKSGDEATYQHNYSAWKENTDLAVKRHQMQREAFSDALRLRESDMRAGDAELRSVMTKFGMEKERVMWEHGMIPEVMKLQEQQATAMEHLEKSKQEIENSHAKRDALQRLQKARQFEDPEIPATVEEVKKAEQNLQDVLEATSTFGRGGLSAAASRTKQAQQADEAAEIVQGIIEGKQPPIMTGLYGRQASVRAGLQKAGFDLQKATLEWKSAEQQVRTLSQAQMVRFQGLATSVVNTIDEVRELSKEMKLSGIPALNRVELEAYIQVHGNSKNGQLATRYVSAVNTLASEFANLEQGGYAPTEEVWKLANRQINANYGVNQMDASLTEIQRLINYRINAIPGLKTLGPSAPNRYVPPSKSSGEGADPLGIR